MGDITRTIEFETPLLIAHRPDPFFNVWTPEALRNMAAQKPDELRYDERMQTLYVRQGVNIRYVDKAESDVS